MKRALAGAGQAMKSISHKGKMIVVVSSQPGVPLKN